MANIKNLDDLRRHAIETLTRLEKREIDVSQAGVTAKLYESIMSSLKTELEYHKMLDQRPCIPFIEGAEIKEISQTKQPYLIEGKKTK